MESNIVLVTGFGPFREHKINASWESVKLLPELNPDPNIRIIIEEIPVSYKDVEEKVFHLWNIHKPLLVIHVGVSSLSDKLTLETKANRTGYLMTDCNNILHPTGECCPLNNGSDVIHCRLNIELICDEVNSKSKQSIACTSDNAGRYLCEFIFYQSLNVNDKKTIFIHVPPLDKQSAEEIAKGILLVVQAALKQLKCNCN